MNHLEIQDRLEEYVFGTLDEETRLAVELHLSTCESCSQRVVELMRTSAMIAEHLEKISPTADLRTRILSGIEDGTKQKLRESESRNIHWLWYLSAAATLALAVISYTLWSDRRALRAELEKMKTERTTLQTELSRYEDATMLLGQPGMQFVDLSGVDPNPQAFGKAILDPTNGSAVVYMYKLPPTPEGKAYKLWVMREGKPTTAGEFTVAPDGSAVLSLDKISDMSQIATFQVTIEDAGRAQLPTGMMYLTGPYTPASN